MAKFVIIFAVVLTVASACDFDESSYSVERSGGRSEAVDDAEATATCQKGETMVACRCDTFANDPEPCDGSSIRETADGYICVAKNNAIGKGVKAVATCQEVVITCNSEYGNMPEISCPKDFKPISCTMHTNFMHTYNPGKPNRPQSKRDGNKCYTSNGCENCKVQARCIRTTNF